MPASRILHPPSPAQWLPDVAPLQINFELATTAAGPGTSRAREHRCVAFSPLGCAQVWVLRDIQPIPWCRTQNPGLKGLRELDLLITREIRAGKRCLLHTTKGILFFKGVEVNQHGNVPGFVVLRPGCLL